MGVLQLSNNVTVTGATSTEITITDGSNTIELFGSFSFSSTDVFGTVTGLREFERYHSSSGYLRSIPWI